MLRINYNSCNIKTLQEIKVLFYGLWQQIFLIIAPVLIEMSLWIYIRHRHSRRAWPIVVRTSDFISRNVENDRSAGAEDTGSVAKILSKLVVLLQEKYPVGKVCKPFFKPQHQNDFDKIFASALSVASVIREETESEWLLVQLHKNWIGWE